MDMKARIIDYDLTSLEDIKVFNGTYTEILQLFSMLKMKMKTYSDDVLLCAFSNQVIEDFEQLKGKRDIKVENIQNKIQLTRDAFDAIIKMKWSRKNR